jgi:hypothetical protein
VLTGDLDETDPTTEFASPVPNSFRAPRFVIVPGGGHRVLWEAIFPGFAANLHLIYSSMGYPSIDPELMIGMLVVGYVFAIRSGAG